MATKQEKQMSKRDTDPCGKITDADLCVGCQHPSSWHRHDDVACSQSHPQPCYPDIAPFRCLGYDVMADKTPALLHDETFCGHACPDFVDKDRP